MPPSTLQARIKAFEALGMGASKQILETVAVHSEAEHLLDTPLSPTAPSIPPIVPTVYTPSTSPSSLRRKSSLVDLKDWVIDDGPLQASSPTAVLSDYSPPKPFETAPLINFEGPPPKLPKAPPLPPRQSSYTSLRSVSAPATSPILMSTSPSANMLMPPDADHSYPPTLSKNKLSTSDGIRRAHGHVQASSVSSFYSVSLSSDGGDPTAVGVGPLHAFPMEREWTVASTEDGESLDESFENVSAPSSFLPPITLPPRPPILPGNPALAVASKPPPPPLPPKRPHHPPSQQWGSSPSSITSPVLALTPSGSSSTPSLTGTRRVPPPLPITSPPPPPPPRSRPPSARTSVQSTATTASDRSSLFSTTSRTSISSRTSVSPSKISKPGAKPSPRARYDALFLANVRAHAPRKPQPPPPPPPLVHAKRQNAGWRGLSIDLDQSAHLAPAPAAPAPEPGPDARLDGRLVRKIWLKSGLEPQRLRDIWDECDLERSSSLDRDAFAQGMARIDEELRRAQVLGRARAASGAPRRAPSRPILR